MRKATVVKLFVGSLIGLGAALVLFFVAGALAMMNGVFVMNGPDVVGVNPSWFGWTMIGLAALAALAMAAAGIVQFVAWIGAVFNTAGRLDKTWFVVLLVLGLFSLALPAMIAYVIAGPDDAETVSPNLASDPSSVPDVGSVVGSRPADGTAGRLSDH